MSRRLFLSVVLLAGCGQAASPPGPSAEELLRAALEKPVSVEADEQPFDEAVSQLATDCGVNIEIDLPAFRAAGIRADKKISLALREVSLRCALNHLLAKIDGPQSPAYVVDKGRVLITSADSAAKRLEARIYPVDELIAVHVELSGQDVAAAVRSLAPRVWEKDNGDDGGIITKPGVLVVTASQPRHRRIARLLQQMRQVANGDADIGNDGRRSPAEQRIETALNSRGWWPQGEPTLEELARQIAEKYQISVVVDADETNKPLWGPLASRTTPKLAKVTLRETLDVVLELLDDGWLVWNDALVLNRRQVGKYQCYATECWPLPRDEVFHNNDTLQRFKKKVWPPITRHLRVKIGTPYQFVHAAHVPGGVGMLYLNGRRRSFGKFFRNLRRAADPRVVDYSPHHCTPSAASLARKLDKLINVDLDRVPVYDALEYLSDVHDFPFFWQGTDAPQASVDAARLVTVHFKQMPLRAVLTNILPTAYAHSSSDDNGVLLILPFIEQRQTTRIYRLGQLTEGPFRISGEQLHYACWLHLNYGCSMIGATNPFGPLLAATHTNRRHRELEAYLRALLRFHDPAENRDVVPVYADATALDDVLRGQVDIHADGVPLTKLIDQLAKGHPAANLRLNPTWLDEFRDPLRRYRITLHARSTLAEALSALCEHLNHWLLTLEINPIAWTVRDHAVVFSSRENLESSGRTVLYRWPPTSRGGSGTAAIGLSAREFEVLVWKHAAPAEWTNIDTRGEILRLPRGMVITTSRRAQREVRELYQRLRSADACPRRVIGHEIRPRSRRLVADERITRYYDAGPLREAFAALSPAANARKRTADFLIQVVNPNTWSNDPSALSFAWQRVAPTGGHWAVSLVDRTAIVTEIPAAQQRLHKLLEQSDALQDWIEGLDAEESTAPQAEMFVAGLNHKAELVRAAAAYSLGQSATLTERVEAELIRALEDDKVAVRLCALYAVSRRPTQWRNVKHAVAAVARRAADDKSLEVRRRAVTVGGSFGDRAAFSVDRLAVLLHSPDEQLRRYTINALIQVGAAAIPALTKTARRAEPRIRRDICQNVLPAIGPAAIDALIDLTKAGEDADVRVGACRGLKQLGLADDRAVAALEACRGGRNPVDVQRAAEDSLEALLGK